MTNLFFKISVYFWSLYLKYTDPIKKKPVGIPYHRDPDDICEFYEPFKKARYKFQDCEGNGHELCKKCYHLAPVEIEEEFESNPKEGWKLIDKFVEIDNSNKDALSLNDQMQLRYNELKAKYPESNILMSWE